MRVVIAPDSFGGTLTAREAAVAIAAGWQEARPGDDVVTRGMSDGGEGLVDVLATADPDWDRRAVEVAGPRGTPVTAEWLLGEDRHGPVAVVEVALACGLALVEEDRRDPLLATSHGVGQLLDATRVEGARRVLVGLGGSATVDGGLGALTGLGMTLLRADGSGLKVGGGWMHELDRIELGWLDPGWADVEVDLLADVRTTLPDAAAVFGPQKGADEAAVRTLTDGLATAATVVERDLDVPGLSRRPGTGAAGGLGFALAAALGARLRAGAPVVAGLVDLDDALRGADLVVTGEGRIDATTTVGKVVGEVAERARTFDVPWVVVAGSGDLPDDVDGELSAPNGPGDDPTTEVAAAASRLAARIERGRRPRDRPHAVDVRGTREASG